MEEQKLLPNLEIGNSPLFKMTSMDYLKASLMDLLGPPSF